MKYKYSVYRASKGQGSEARFETGVDKEQNKTFWLNIAAEKSDGKAFDWENGITCKIGLSDLGELCRVLNGSQEGIGAKSDKGYYGGLFHKNPSGNSTIDLSKSTQRPGFRLNVGQDNNGNKTRHSISISESEGYNLLQLFNRAIVMLMEDHWQPSGGTAEPAAQAQVPAKATLSKNKQPTESVGF